MTAPKLSEEDLRAFANRDWDLVAHARALRPDWPSPEERREDLETHIRVSEALRRVRFLGLLVVILFTGCLGNAPPHYEKSAELILSGREPVETVRKLVRGEPLSAEEAERLTAYDQVPVLHLVGRNPGTPRVILERLASHPHFEVRTGVAGNREAPLDLLLGLRTAGEYTTVNATLSMNPRLPPAILAEMYRGGETGAAFVGRNPSCPPEVLWAIADDPESSATERVALAQNPRLPVDLLRRLAADEDALVRAYVALNPGLTPDLRAALADDEDPTVRRWLTVGQSRK